MPWRGVLGAHLRGPASRACASVRRTPLGPCRLQSEALCLPSAPRGPAGVWPPSEAVLGPSRPLSGSEAPLVTPGSFHRVRFPGPLAGGGARSVAVCRRPSCLVPPQSASLPQPPAPHGLRGPGRAPSEPLPAGAGAGPALSWGRSPWQGAERGARLPEALAAPVPSARPSAPPHTAVA